MNISELSISRPSLPLVILIITVLAGLFLGSQLKYELIPDISTTTIVVTTVYPGAGSEDIEKSVTIPLEDAFAKMEGVDEMSSSSMEGLSLIKLFMDFNIDPDVALQDAKEKIDKILKDLPEDIRTPSISKVDLSALPIITIGASSNLNTVDFFQIIDHDIQPALAQITGVANVNIIGGVEKEIKVKIDENKLRAYNFNLKQVLRMIKASNLELPAGKIKNNQRQTDIRLSGKFNSIAELKESIIGYSNLGEAIRLQEIAEVFEGTKDLNTIAKINGINAIGIEISKQKEANAVEVSEQVQQKLKVLSEEYKDAGLLFETANDSSIFTINAAKAVGQDLLLAILLVSLIMLLFLKSYRNTLFVLVTIPSSLIGTLLTMYLFDFSLNLISLTALSLVVGTVVDDAIVVIENIHRHMEMGKNKIQATKDSMKEVGLTLVSTTAVLSAVFIPLATVTGITGQILHEFAVTIIAAMVFSLLFTFTLVPLLSSRYAKISVPKDNKLNRLLNGFEIYMERTAHQIRKALVWALGHKKITLGMTILIFCSSIFLVSAGYIGTSFMDAGDRGNVIMRLEFSKDIRLNKNAKVTSQVEQIILSQKGVKTLYTTIGQKTGGAVSGAKSTPYYTEFNIVFVPSNERQMSSNLLARILRSKIEEEVAGVKVSSANVNMMGNEDIPLQIYLKGDPSEQLFKASQVVIEMLSSIKGTTEIESSLNLGNPEMRVEFDRQKMAFYGLTIGEVSTSIQTAFAGNTDNKYRVGDQEYDINVSFNQENSNNISDLENLVFYSPKGDVILNQFAKVKVSNGPTVLERYNRSSSATIKSQLVGISQGAAQKQFEAMVKEKGLPEGVSFDYSGRTKLMAKSFSALGIAFTAAIIFMYLIMVLLYNNWLHPLAVLFTIPLAIIGALYALALANENLSLFTILGIIMLSGLVAKNAILVIDFANDLQRKGKQLSDSITEAVLLRFRAILMTNISMIIGLIPLAISSGAGSEWKNGIGWVLIGGLTVSMFLSMIIVPIIYHAFENLRVKFVPSQK